MAEAPRSSFIPKQTKTAVSSRVHKKKHFNTLSLVSTIVLIASLVFAGGTYFYRDYLQKELEEEKQALTDERGRFSESDIASIRELDRQFAAAEYLLSNHLAPSKIFDALELTTKETVQFTSFSLARLSGQEVSLTVGGATEEFKSIALQALEFGDEPLLENMVFTQFSNNQETDAASEEDADVAAPEAPQVTFNVEGDILPGLLLYDGVPEEPVEAPETTAPTSTGTTTNEVSNGADNNETITDNE